MNSSLRRAIGVAAIMLLGCATQVMRAPSNITDYSAVEFDYSSLKKLIATENIRTIEQLTSALPPELQTNITFMRDSHSRIQPGARAIRFTESGKLVLTHSLAADQVGGLHVEAMEDFDDGEQVLHDIEFFADGSRPPAYSEDRIATRNPEGCVGCHGTPVRKIWSSYPLWPGACGFRDDVADADCLKFLSWARTQERLKGVKWADDDPAWPYKSNSRKYPKRGTLNQRPNLELTYITNIDNARQVGLRLTQSPLFERLKYTMASLELCDPAVAKVTQLEYILAHLPETLPPVDWEGTREEYVKNILYLPGVRIFGMNYNLIEFMGIRNGTIGGNEALERGGVTRIDYASSIFTRSTASYVTDQILRLVAKVDPVVQEAIVAAAIRYSEIYPDDAAPSRLLAKLDRSNLISSKIQSICPHLLTQSQNELNALLTSLTGSPSLPRGFAIAQTANPAFVIDEVKRGLAVLERAQCINCHDSNDGIHVGPHIALRDPNAFRHEIAEAESYGDNLLEMIRSRTDPKRGDETRMPLRRPPLTTSERQALMTYLEAISH